MDRGLARGTDEEYLSQNLNTFLRELESVGINTAGQLTGLLEKWRDVVFKESKKAFEVATKPAASEDTHSPFARPTSAWQTKTRHFYVPLGLARKSLGHEFPSYRPPGLPQAPLGGE